MENVGRIFLAVAAVTLLVREIVGAEQSVTQILSKNGLPKGLLPSTVRSYTLSANGKFQVNLRSTCTTKIASEEVYYKKTITGDLSYRKISNLTGIQVHEFFWLAVTSIEVDTFIPKTIWFKVGYFSKALNTDLFKVAPVCNFVGEEQADREAMTFSEWLDKALSGVLEVNVPQSQDVGVARKLLQ